MKLFQFETMVGGDCIRKLNPNNLTELGNANALMRLTVEGEGEEQPIDKYLRFKEHPEQWDEEDSDHTSETFWKNACPVDDRQILQHQIFR